MRETNPAFYYKGINFGTLKNYGGEGSPAVIFKPRLVKVTFCKAITFLRNLLRRYAGRSTSAGNFKICWRTLHYQSRPYVSAKLAAGLPGRTANFKGIAVGVGEMDRLAPAHH